MKLLLFDNRPRGLGVCDQQGRKSSLARFVYQQRVVYFVHCVCTM